MNARTLIEHEWPYILTFLPPSDVLETTARELGAFRRRRSVDSPSVLLRLALVYGLCGLSLRQTTAWAEAADIASLSDVALLNRLRKAAPWLGHLLALKLAERAPPPPPAEGLSVRLVDATSISQPGSKGTDWRIHLGFDLQKMAIDEIELTDVSGGETLSRFHVAPGQLMVGDRGYAKRRGLRSVIQSRGHFIVRLNWATIPLLTPTGDPFDLFGTLRRVPDARSSTFEVAIAPEADGLLALPVRLAVLRKSEAAAAESRRKILRNASKKQRKVDPRTLEAASYMILLSSPSVTRLPGHTALEFYRFRWQVELAFKRLKSLMSLGALPAKDPLLARAYLCAKLLAALVLEELTDEFLAFSPWGYRLR